MRSSNIKLNKLNRNELHRYLGYRGDTPDSTVRGIVDKCEEKLFKVIRPAYISKVFDICEYYVEGVYKGIEVLGTNLILEGESIRKHLALCNQAILMSATLSIEADKLIRQTELKDMAEALILDTAASVAIEQVCEIAEESIKNYFPEKYMTYRYGVGYGDLPLYHEKIILDILDAGKFIGLYVNDSNILTPRKSVVCIIGLCDMPMPKGQKGCVTCNMKEKCDYRRQGLSCAY